MEEVYQDMGIEEDVERRLDDHGNRIQKLEIDMAGVKEKLNSVEGIVTRFETNYYQTSNSMMQQNSNLIQQMSQLVTNTSNNVTQIATTNSNNNTQISAKKIGLYGTLITGFIGIASLIVKAIFGA